MQTSEYNSYPITFVKNVFVPHLQINAIGKKKYYTLLLNNLQNLTD